MSDPTAEEEPGNAINDPATVDPATVDPATTADQSGIDQAGANQSPPPPVAEGLAADESPPPPEAADAPPAPSVGAALVSDPPDPPYDPDAPLVEGDTAGAVVGSEVAEVAEAAPVCPACNEVVGPEAKWCEACGGDLTGGGAPPIATPDAKPLPPCVSCAADGSEITDDGYCSQCGYKQPAERDHTETDLGALAGVSDRGKRHRHNEDSFAMSTGDGFRVLVVCDGVSTTAHSEDASQLAADTASAFLAESVAADVAASDAALEALTVEAILAAQAAVSALPPSPEGEASPSCTIVASVLLLAPGAEEGRLIVGWLGDSRGYWIDTEGAHLLTFDHSWAAEQVREGVMTEEAAMADPRAHSITRWIGADAVEINPETATRTVVAGGKLLLCSDGLWNYRPTEAEMAEAVATHSEFAETPVALARSLTAMANELGGHDNITVLIAQT